MGLHDRAIASGKPQKKSTESIAACPRIKLVYYWFSTLFDDGWRRMGVGRATSVHVARNIFTSTTQFVSRNFQIREGKGNLK